MGDFSSTDQYYDLLRDYEVILKLAFGVPDGIIDPVGYIKPYDLSEDMNNE